MGWFFSSKKVAPPPPPASRTAPQREPDEPQEVDIQLDSGGSSARGGFSVFSRAEREADGCLPPPRNPDKISGNVYRVTGMSLDNSGSMAGTPQDILVDAVDAMLNIFRARKVPMYLIIRSLRSSMLEGELTMSWPSRDVIEKAYKRTDDRDSPIITAGSNMADLVLKKVRALRKSKPGVRYKANVLFVCDGGATDSGERFLRNLQAASAEAAFFGVGISQFNTEIDRQTYATLYRSMGVPEEYIFSSELSGLAEMLSLASQSM